MTLAYTVNCGECIVSEVKSVQVNNLMEANTEFEREMSSRSRELEGQSVDVPSTDEIRAWEERQLRRDRDAEDARITGEGRFHVRKRGGDGDTELGGRQCAKRARGDEEDCIVRSGCTVPPRCENMYCEVMRRSICSSREKLSQVMSMLQCVSACIVLHPNDSLRMHAHAFVPFSNSGHNGNVNPRDRGGTDGTYCKVVCLEDGGTTDDYAGKDTVVKETGRNQCMNDGSDMMTCLKEMEAVTEAVRQSMRCLFDVVVRPDFHNRKPVPRTVAFRTLQTAVSLGLSIPKSDRSQEAVHEHGEASESSRRVDRDANSDVTTVPPPGHGD